MPEPAPPKRQWRSEARSSRFVAVAIRALGARVKYLRKAAGLTQEGLADRARLDTKHLQSIEAGKVNVTVASLVGLARALETPIASLFTTEKA